MYCDACGTAVEQGQQFCRACGKPIGGVPTLPRQSRMSGHVRLLGILWLAISAFRLLPGGALLFFGHAGWPMFGLNLPFLPPLLTFVGYWMALSALAGFITGWGLLSRQPWARLFALVLACFALLDPPFGTALGIYTLWVLLPQGAEAAYRRLSSAA